MNTDLSKSFGAPPQPAPEIIDSKLRKRWRSYLAQVGGATLYLAAALLLAEGLGNLAVVSAIAASAFLTFCLPSMPMSQPRRMLGGHTVALLVTLAVLPLRDELPGQVAIDILAALSVGATMLLMAVTNTEHPPAAGTALGLSLQPWQGEAAICLLVMVALLLAVHQAGRGRMANLL